MKRILLVASLAAAALLLPRAAGAQTSNILTVEATVADSCTISSPQTFTLGNYTGALLDASGSFTVECNENATYHVTLDGGNNGPNATFGTSRQLNNGTNMLAYELYRDAPGGVVWDAGAYANTTAPASGSQTVNIHGRIPAGQFVPAGLYSDSVTMTVVF